MLTQERLKEVLKYNPDTGIFIWERPSRSKVTKGEEAGCLCDGYIQIGIDYVKYRAHRLAWLYMEGYFPEQEVDHKDRVRRNNKWENLRLVSNQCQSRNIGNFTHNKSGVKGVSWIERDAKWGSWIKVDRKNRYLGQHDYFTEAVCHRLAAEQCLDWEGCDASSPAYKFITGELNETK